MLFITFNTSKKGKLKIPNTIIVFFVKDLIDLNLANLILKRKFLKILIVKKIYNDYKLCYYFKKNYFNIIVKTCLNNNISLKFN